MSHRMHNEPMSSQPIEDSPLRRLTFAERIRRVKPFCNSTFKPSRKAGLIVCKKGYLKGAPVSRGELRTQDGHEMW